MERWRVIELANVGPDARAELEAAWTVWLAAVARERYRNEMQRRCVYDPYPLRVRFDESFPLNNEVRINEVRILDIGRLTGAKPSLPGRFDKIGAAYQSIPSGRLVVLGGAGAGKTVLVLGLVLDRLSNYVPGDHVPMIFNLRSWDPTAISLRDWMCRQLVRDYPDLAAPAAWSSGSVASALVAADRILPVLDGFDEIASGLRAPALEALNDDYGGPLVVTGRIPGYAPTLRGGAARIELEPLTSWDLEEHLARASPLGATRGAAWNPVVGLVWRLGKRDDLGRSNVDAALSTPLMLTLARTVYSNSETSPLALLNIDRFPTPKAIEEDLLAEVVPAAYRQPPDGPEGVPVPGARQAQHWEPDHVEYWFSYLAWHMKKLGRHEIAWWELGATMSLRSRMLAIGVTLGFASMIVTFVAFGLTSGLQHAIVAAPVSGLAAGLTFGLMHAFATKSTGGGRFDPWLTRMRIGGGARAVQRMWAGFLPKVGGGVVGGLLFGMLCVLGCALYLAVFGGSGSVIALATGQVLAYGAGVGTAVGLLATLGPLFKADIGSERSVHPGTLRKNRSTVLTELLVVGLVIGTGSGIIIGLRDGTATGITAGLATGLVAGLGVSTMTAWGRWVVLVRLWLPATGRLPWDVNAFLDDACRRDVLRQAGAVYAFRYSALQPQLASYIYTHPYGSIKRGLEAALVKATFRRTPLWIIWLLIVLVLFAIATGGSADLLGKLQSQGHLNAADAPVVVTTIVSISGAIGALVGGILAGMAKLVQARGHADAERILAEAALVKARAEAKYMTAAANNSKQVLEHPGGKSASVAESAQ